MHTPSHPAAYKIPQFAAELGVCRATVYNMIARNELRVVRIGRAVRIPRSELDRLLAGEAQPTSGGAA